MHDPNVLSIHRRLIRTSCWILFVTVMVVAGPLSADDKREGIEFFEQHVRPLLIEHCYECHAAGEDSGGLRLDSKAAWQAGGESGPAIVAGDPEQSRLIEAVRYTNLNLQMPPSGKLSSAQIASLEQWIAFGAPDPRDGPMATAPPLDSVDGGAPPVTGMSIDDGRNFWSLRPLSDPTVPEVTAPQWVANPIDAFILSRLETAGLHPAPPAERRALIRRVTFDLVGLPPTPAEVEAFVADPSPQAFQKVCERLLASPQYGERWGRHWLDVARYADSNGLDENLAFGNAWRYRDYVISSFNHDKPFDRFVIEQLAGDLLPNLTPETLTGTGFLMLGAKVLAEPDREKLVMDTVDEQIDATGKTFMGMTLGCARCHDHKFDPILQRDYYALAGFFKSTRTFDGTAMGAIKHWHEHPLATDSELAQLKAVDAEIAAKTKAANEFKSQAMSRLRSAALEKAPRYLSAASQCAPRASFKEIQPVAASFDLHPRILYNLRVQLELRSDEPVLNQWHQLAIEETPVEKIEEYFAQLLQLAEKPSAGEERDETQTAWALRLKELLPQLLVVPVQPEFALDEPTLHSYYELMDAARVVESTAPDATSVMGVSDGQILVSVPIHIRGSHRNLGEPVPRGFPTVMQSSNVPVVLPRHQSGRLELAQWIASSQHPLTARVYVNRIWRWHFGRGLVASTENFGLLGDSPSHPQLLDWLARNFIESDWSTKELHRLILASNTYQMAASHPEEEQALALDPENELLWKFRRQRLEAEQLRDSILAVCGSLDETMGGKTVPLRNRQFVFNHTSQDYTRYDSLRRAVYLPIIRNNVYTLFEQFDFPDATMPVGNRQATVIATQALLMLNDDLVMDAAQRLAERLCVDYSQPAERAAEAYRLALGRPADEDEVQRATQFVQQMLTQQPFAQKSADKWAWGLFCHALLASNEFMTIE
jgi:mono/diheme cytochrome c family protein